MDLCRRLAIINRDRMSESKAQDTPFPSAWTSTLETGVSTIDLQHRVLFDLLQRTREAVSRGVRVELRDVLEQLRAYAGYHFSHEEEWIARHTRRAAGAAPHAQLHAGFLAQLESLERQWQCGTADLDGVLGFLGRWLIDHIVRTDIPLIRSLQSVAPSGEPAVEQGPA